MNKSEKEREVKRRGETRREERRRRCEFEVRVRLIEIRMNSRRGGRKVGG